MTAPARAPTLHERKFHERRLAFRADIAAKAAALAKSKLAPAPVVVAPAVGPIWIEPQGAVSYETKPDAIPPRPDNPFWFSLVDFQPAPITLGRIIEMVCAEFKVSKTAMLSSRRTKEIVDVRQCAMWLCKEFTRRSLPEIGRRFGGRDHTTVIHAHRSAPRKLAADDELRLGIMKIYAELSALQAQADEATKLAEEVGQFPEQSDGQ